MFTEQFLQKIENGFAAQMQRLGEGRKQVEDVLRQCSSQEAEALKCLYASMPVSDAVDYPAELYLSYAKHGVDLWEKGPFAGEIPEELFAGYVLHHRVNNEDVTDSRPFFYEQLKDVVEGKNMEEAILAVNYWCASQATYRTTDGRTASAAAVFRSAYGRCGEESTFGVTVLRSVGIPARQVYVPLWSHCDDNHAWVEVWCDGKWRFLGACEPEEVLNKGWFTNASSRAMMVHSRWLLPSEPEDDIVGKRGMSQVLNQLKRYAHTTQLEVSVVEENGTPAAGAEVRFEVLNYACFGEIASVHADQAGRCVLETGMGTIHVTAFKDGSYAETLVNTQETNKVDIILSALPAGAWEEMIVLAPKDAPINRSHQSSEEIARGRKKFEEVTALRQEKENSFYNEELAEEMLADTMWTEEEKAQLRQIMKLSRGNRKEIADFLSRPTDGNWPERWKLDILNSLREKDYLDITADILEENCTQAAGFAERYEEEIFVPYILCPRVENEMIRPFRSFINSWLAEEEKTAMTKDPSLVWKRVSETLKADDSLEYGNLITSAKGALTSGYGSMLTQKVVSVQILRTLGIPARLNPEDNLLEIWRGGHFLALEERAETGKERTAGIIVCEQEGKAWTYFQNWTIARFEENGYKTLQLCDESGESIYGEISLFPGTYRILTANRLPNGNIFAKKLDFELKDGEKREIVLEQMEAQPGDLLEDNDITEFTLRTEDGEAHQISELVKEKKGLFIWLEETKEPTEHILNEIYQRKEKFNQLDANLYFVISSPKAKEDPTLKRTLSAVPNVQFLLDDFGADMGVLARRMYLEPGKLPLIVIIDEKMTGIYGVAGYNVGTADMILKILTFTCET